MAGEWREYRIGEIAEIIGGSTPSTADPSNFDGEIPWLTPKDLSGPHDRYVSRGERSLSRKGLDSCSAQLLPPGTVLLTSRAPIGYLAIAKNPIATNQGFRNLIPKPLMNSEFLYYWLKGHVEELQRHASGSTFQELSGTALAQIRIRVPPLPEQRAIAHILGTLDDKIELNRRMSETLEAMARALFKAWFVDFEPVRAKMEGRWRRGESLPGLPAHLYDLFPDRLVESELGEIPEGWEVGTLRRVAEVTSGKRPTRVFAKPSPEATVPLWGGNGPMGYVSESLYSEPILLTGRVGTLGSVFRIQGASWPSDNTLVVLPQSKAAFEFLYFCLERFDFDALNRGSTQPLLTQSDLGAQNVLIPADPALREFHKYVSTYFRMIDQATDESRTLAALRDALLPKLISGELRVRDAERFLKERGL
ncbi:restriction endonuclease subunit S [Thermus islandicus]|uniref:restriction endonuclease subunit S n=1 Tax=Thermus islandicus TaxID=540988 RepID=UPI0004913175|nr:restriction endonuclease subunit S [Thermus islandicus]